MSWTWVYLTGPAGPADSVQHGQDDTVTDPVVWEAISWSSARSRSRKLMPSSVIGWPKYRKIWVYCHTHVKKGITRTMKFLLCSQQWTTGKNTSRNLMKQVYIEVSVLKNIMPCKDKHSFLKWTTCDSLKFKATIIFALVCSAHFTHFQPPHFQNSSGLHSFVQETWLPPTGGCRRPLRPASNPSSVQAPTSLSVRLHFSTRLETNHSSFFFFSFPLTFKTETIPDAPSPPSRSHPQVFFCRVGKLSPAASLDAAEHPSPFSFN